MPSRALTLRSARRCGCAATSLSEEAATKLIWLVLRNVQARWENPPISWHAAKTQLAIQFEQRFMLTD